ncbi:hypothetical protein FRC17_009896, partial [Serendipita sp. 399]
MSSAVWRFLDAFRSRPQSTPIPLSNTYDERDNNQQINSPGLIRAFTISTAVSPCWFYLFNFDPIPAFSPKYIIYPHNYSLLFLFFAPWAGPQTFPAVLSRLLQAVLLWRLPLSSISASYTLWILIALSRTLVGFILSRGIGWAYPSLFRHYALYEMSSGFGPMLWAYLELTGGSDLSKARMTPKLRTYLLIALVVILCWLDNTPWTYAITIILTTSIHLAQIVWDSRRWQDISTSKPAVMSQFRHRLAGTIIALLIISAPYWAFPHFFPPIRNLIMPQSPFPPSPLLDIMILSFPRPNAAIILNKTISSYLHHIGYDTRLSLYTYSTDHPAFQEMQNEYQNHDVTFHINNETHPDSIDGHYLHLSEAFKWANDKGVERAEWIMLVEDDFPICGDEAGWEAFVRVMTILEDGRSFEEEDPKQLKRIPKRRGGFIGTGG